MNVLPARAAGYALVALALATGLLVPVRAGTTTRVTTEDVAVVSASPDSPSTDPQIAMLDDGSAHVVWQQTDADAPVIMHSFRAPSGQWSPPTEVFWGGTQPALATDGSSVVVAFVRAPFDRLDVPEIMFNRWDAVAGEWQDEATALEGDVGLGGSQPALAFDRAGGTLWLVWTSSRRAENVPYYARIQVATGQIESADVIERYEEGAQGPAVVVDAEENVYAAWSANYPSGEAEIVLWKWPSGGSYWIQQETAGYGELRQARAPGLAASRGVVCLVWHEGTLAAPNEIVLSCDKASGNIWLGNISHSPGRSLVPSLALDDLRGAMVAWRERGSPAPDNILFSQGLPPAPSPAPVTDGGSTVADAPSLAYYDGYAYGVWVEGTAPGGSDIHFARWRVDIPTPTPTSTATRSATRPPSVTPTASVTTPATTRTITPTGTRPTMTPTATRTPGGPRAQIYLPLAEAGRPR